MLMDIIKSYERKPEPLKFVLPGFLTGTVGTLFSTGGSGKSMFALQACMAIACDQPGGDLLNLQPESNGRVYYMSSEETAHVLDNRLHDITQHMPWQAVHAIQDRLELQPMYGLRTDLGNDDHLRRIIDYAYGARLIVLDTISRMHRMDENSNGDMADLITRLEKIAADTGAAVLYIHHANKASSREGSDTEQHASRGASALVDNARWGASIRRMSKDEAENRGYYVRYDMPKVNYSPPMGTKWFKRGPGGVLFPRNMRELNKSSSRGGK